MKKTTLSLLLVLCLCFTAIAQTVHRDTVFTKALIPGTLDTLRSRTITTTTTTVAAVTIPVDTIRYVNTGGGMVTIGGTTSNPINCSSNTTYQYLTINMSGKTGTAVTISGKTNVHIHRLKILNAPSYAIFILNSTNITIDSCFMNGVAAGVVASGGSNIKVNNNQVKNCNGNGTLWTFGHPFQFIGVGGTGNTINYNRIENIAGVAVNPHDGISTYKCFPTDTLFIIGNMMRGGQRALQPDGKSGGACFITIADVTGSNQVARGNIGVNVGYAGIQCIGSGTNVKIDHNSLYSAVTPISLVGYSIQDKNQIYCGYNRTKWTNSAGRTSPDGSGVPQYWLSSSPKPVGWSTNTWNDSGINSTILPTTLITFQ